MPDTFQPANEYKIFWPFVLSVPTLAQSASVGRTVYPSGRLPTVSVNEAPPRMLPSCSMV